MSEETEIPAKAPYWTKVDHVKISDNSNIRTYEHRLPSGALLLLVRSVVCEMVTQNVVYVPAPTLFQYSNVAGGGNIDPYRVY